MQATPRRSQEMDAGTLRIQQFLFPSLALGPAPSHTTGSASITTVKGHNNTVILEQKAHVIFILHSIIILQNQAKSQDILFLKRINDDDSFERHNDLQLVTLCLKIFYFQIQVCQQKRKDMFKVKTPFTKGLATDSYCLPHNSCGQSCRTI